MATLVMILGLMPILGILVVTSVLAKFEVDKVKRRLNRTHSLARVTHTHLSLPKTSSTERVTAATESEHDCG
jgi:hypothetical protein